MQRLPDRRLDNRFENLQLVTRAQDLLKNNRQYDNKAGYIGVLRRVDGRSSGTRYRACVNHGGKTHWFGTFATPEEAAREHDRRAIELQGEFANLNFPT